MMLLFLTFTNCYLTNHFSDMISISVVSTEYIKVTVKYYTDKYREYQKKFIHCILPLCILKERWTGISFDILDLLKEEIEFSYRVAENDVWDES